MAATDEQPSFFHLQLESPSSSCSSSPPTSMKPVDSQHELDSGCGSDEDPALALKINKGLSMGYDYELIKSVIQQQNDGDDMSKFIETIVRTAEVAGHGNTPTNNHHSPSSKSTSPTLLNQKTSTADIDSSSTNSTSSDNPTSVPHDIYIIDGADLAYSYGNSQFSWRGIEICIKYLHSHGHKKVFVALPYTLKHHRHDQNFLESKSLRDLERKNMLVYTNRTSKPTNKPGSYTHISEMLKFSQKTKGHLITNVSLKDVILDFTIYKHILEERVIRYRFQNDNFQPLLVTIVSGDDGNDCETHYPLCPYGKKCTYGSKCKYFHIERRYQSPLSITESLQMKARLEKSKLQHHLSNPTMLPIVPNPGLKPGFHPTKSGPEQLRMYNDRQSPVSIYPMMDQSLVDDARAAYDYGLSSASSPTADFSFVDQRAPLQAPRQATLPTHQSWFGTPAAVAAPQQSHPFFNRSFSMPQPSNIFPTNDSQRMLEEQQHQQMAAALLMHQQQQNWARQQQQQQSIFQQPPQQFEQNVLRLLSMLSIQQQQQQQSNLVNTNSPHLANMNTIIPSMTVPSVHPQSQENRHDRAYANSQQGLADKIQAVRHLWESENPAQLVHPMTSYSQSQADPSMYNHLATGTFQAASQGFLPFQ